MVTLSLKLDSDFDDIFTVRGITGPTNGKLLPQLMSVAF